MRDCRRFIYWLLLAIAGLSIGVLSFSCRTQQMEETSPDQAKEISSDVRLLSRIGRATSRYRASLDLTGYAQSTVERSLADRHWRMNREILKLEFAQAKLEIEQIAALKDKGVKAKQTGDIKQQDEAAAVEAEKIRERVERIKQRLADAEQKQKQAKSSQDIEQAQVELKRTRQRLEIAQREMALSEANLKFAEMQRKESDETPEEIKSLGDKIVLLEKESLGEDGTDASLFKWGDQGSTGSVGLMGALRSWWSLYDKRQVLDRAMQRVKRMLDDFKNSQSENQKLREQLRADQRALNRQIRLLSNQANELLERPEQSEKAGKLFEEADAKMNQSLGYVQRREKAAQIQEIVQQKLLLATEDEDSLANWVQVVSDSRARALTRLLKRLGSLLGILLAVFIVAYFVKKIPSRFVKEEKSAYYFRKLIGFITWLIVILIVIFNAAGGIGSISAVIGLAGAGLAIALQDPIVSLVGWFLIIGKYGIRVGDRIEINSVKGDVIDVGMLRVAVTEVGNWLGGDQSTGRMVFFPNSFIFKGHFFNYSTTNSFIWDEVHILVTYESPWKKALDIIVKIAEEASRDVVEKARENQEKLARQFNVSLGNPEAYAYVNIADSGVDLVLRFLSEIKLRRTMRDRICREILEAFEKEKDIQLAYPTHRQLTETRIINANAAAGNDVTSR